MRVECECGKMVDVTVVGGQYQNTYEGTCECGQMWQLIDILAEIDEEEEFENTPEECEPYDCCQCPFGDRGKKQIDCPYVEDGLSGSNFDDPNEDAT